MLASLLVVMENGLVVLSSLGILALISAFLVYRLYAVFTDLELKLNGLEERLHLTENVLKEVRSQASAIRESVKPKADFKVVEKRLNAVTAAVLSKEKVKEKNGS